MNISGKTKRAHSRKLYLPSHTFITVTFIFPTFISSIIPAINSFELQRLFSEQSPTDTTATISLEISLHQKTRLPVSVGDMDSWSRVGKRATFSWLLPSCQQLSTATVFGDGSDFYPHAANRWHGSPEQSASLAHYGLAKAVILICTPFLHCSLWSRGAKAS